MSLTNCLRLFVTVICLGLISLLSSVAPADAQDIIFPPEPPQPVPSLPESAAAFVLDLHAVEARVEGAVAQVRISQRFQNSTQRTIEASYVFPLPTDAAVGDVQMTVDGQVMEGIVYSAEEARAIYEEIVRQQRDPALLEYVGKGLFRTSVFPIPPGAERTVELGYRQVLDRENGLFRLEIPMGGASGEPAKQLGLRVELLDQPGLRTIYSTSHKPVVQRSGADGAVLSLTSQDPAEQKPFVLYFGSDESQIGVNLLSYKPAGERGYFLLLAAPGLDQDEQEIVARDLVLVLDTSGSMQGIKMEQMQQAARHVVESLHASDRFGLIGFSTAPDLWQGRLEQADQAKRDEALAWIDGLRAEGSTDINRALLEALALLDQEDERPAYLLFLTDGLPTQGEISAQKIVANVLRNTPERPLRVFTFGVGFDVNTDLLDTVSHELGGRSQYVLPEQAIDEAVGDFYAQISTPILSSVEVDVAGALVEESYPYPLPDLFAGEQLLWAGRYEGDGPVQVTLRGLVNGRSKEFVYDDLALVERGGEPAVARLWATRKIGALLTEIRRNGPEQELIDAVIALAMEHGIVTPYTSYLVEEPDLAVAREGGGAADTSSRILSAPAAAESAADGEGQRFDFYDEADTGEGAVKQSIAVSALENAERAQEAAAVRFVAGKRFERRESATTPNGDDALWVDSEYREEMVLEVVPFGSSRYFALAATEGVAQMLSLSTELILVLDGEALRITADEDETTSPGSTPSPDADTEVQSDLSDDDEAGVDKTRVGIWERLRRLILGE